jgi:amino acid transporter/nucleotide-binding universal stress UspA family protein
MGGAAKVIIVGSVMFTFISYWKTAAVVLCDLASTAYYIGGIVEEAIGPAAPWFILAVMLFSYAVRSVYLESCSLFVRGGVYRVVKEAMGGLLAKLSVSALMFDYILTGPISGVSAGQYIVGLGLEFIARFTNIQIDPDTAKQLKNWGSVVIACLITLYFFRQNLLGIHESSDKAFKIMIATTIMAVILLSWCSLTLIVEGPRNRVPLAPDFQPHMNYDRDPPEEVDPLGFIGRTGLAQKLRNQELDEVKDGKLTIRGKNGEKHTLTIAPNLRVTRHGKPLSLEDLKPGTPVTFTTDATGAVTSIEATDSQIDWLSLIGILGILMAFGHSILAMSGEETLAQVYREVESPKMPNFKKAAFIVFVYSLLFTAAISFLAVLLIPDDVRMPQYSGNLIGGLAMYVIGPDWARILLNAVVVVVGFLILAGAVNTAIIGSNGVLNRVSEDGVMPDWFLKPHPKYGTSYRILYLIVGLQLAVIIGSRGDVTLLGEAYAFGVVWSFVFKALAMVVLRFRDKSPREFKVPVNIRVGKYEIPIGLSVIFLILLTAAVLNLLTKELATIGGLTFTAVFLTVFIVTEHYHKKRLHGIKHEHLEQFNKQTAEEISPAGLGLKRRYRKLVAIRSTQNLYMLEKTLAETDPATTDVVVMTAKTAPPGDTPVNSTELDTYDQQLMTAVVTKAEAAGKQVKPLIRQTNNPLYTVIRTAMDLHVQELVMGASNKYTADEQLEQIGFYWISLHQGEPPPLTVRILGRDRDVYLDLAGGNRIPRISERRARSVAELRAAGVGVDRVLLVHDGSQGSVDLFEAVLTMLDPQVVLTLVPVSGAEKLAHVNEVLQKEKEQAEKLGRDLLVQSLKGDAGPELVRLAHEGRYDLIVLPLPPETFPGEMLHLAPWLHYILRHAHCQVFLASPPLVPQEVVDK